jgi:F0F1-type ATP synthase membrane subunit c/vacuolar-type H+-ATPase subunit K
MTIEQKIFLKLEPHAKRIRDGEGNDFDYLPAVLLQLIEEQKRQTKILEDTASLLDSVRSTANAVGDQTTAQITGFASAALSKMEQMESAVKDAQTQLHNSQSLISEQIAVLAGAHAMHAKQTDEGVGAIAQQIKSLAVSNQQSQVKFTRLLVAGLVASLAMIGLAVAILQRH